MDMRLMLRTQPLNNSYLDAAPHAAWLYHAAMMDVKQLALSSSLLAIYSLAMNLLTIGTEIAAP
jgi:hypothetical protein